MIEWIERLVKLHPDLAPIAIALSLILAGLSIPISADVVILIAATLAATLLKGSFLKLYLAVFLGSIGAAYVAYANGRFLGGYLLTKPFFQKLFPQARLEKIESHYRKHGWSTLMIGRFIPFGFRNALFISTGLSKFPFASFALRDAVACLLWSFTLFSSLFLLVTKVDDALSVIKKWNVFIFLLVAVTLISWLWYKRIKNRRQKPA